MTSGWIRALIIGVAGDCEPGRTRISAKIELCAAASVGRDGYIPRSRSEVPTNFRRRAGCGSRLARTLRRARRRIRERDAWNATVQAPRSQAFQVDRHEPIAQRAQPGDHPLPNLGLKKPRDLA